MLRTLACCLALALACLRGAPAEKPLIVVTTSLIASAVHDMAGDAFEVRVLMPPGTCPGQFDLEPSQARDARRAALIVRHSRQGFLDSLFVAAGASRAAIVAPEGNFTIPTGYAHYCATLAAELEHRFPSEAGRVRSGYAVLEARLASLDRECLQAAAPYRGRPVIVALFQAETVRWLGLTPVFVLPPSDDPGPVVVRQAVAAGAGVKSLVVVGNVQNGDRMPRLIARTLGRPCAMLGNFPPDTEAGAQEKLIRENLGHLLAALGQP